MKKNLLKLNKPYKTWSILKNAVNKNSKKSSLIEFSCFSKIFEKIACIRLSTFQDNNNLLSNNQFGFCANHSTVHPLLKFMNHVSNALDKKKHCIAICLRFAQGVRHDHRALTPSPHGASYAFLLFGGFFCKADMKSQKRLKR